jgi:hypothetical protein
MVTGVSERLFPSIMCRDEKTEEECPRCLRLSCRWVTEFLINYTPNTALGKKRGRRPEATARRTSARRRRVKERKQLHDQEKEEIESPL